MMLRLAGATLFLGALLAPPPAAAFDLADGRLSVGLTGQVAYGRTDGNTFGTGDEEGAYDNTVLAVTVLGHPTDRLLVAGRIDIESEEEGAEVDWAFAEWRVTDALRLRAGMAKHAFGNYGETLEEGTLRPFFIPPQSVYGPNNIVGEGYTGAGISGFTRLRRWGISYDLYVGELDVETTNSHLRYLDDPLAPTEPPGEDVVIETRDLIGGRLTLETPIDGLVARLSAYTGTEEEYGEGGGDTRHSAFALSGEYLTEALSLRAEFAHSVEANQTTTNAAYLEAAWRFRSGWEVAGRIDASWTDVEGTGGPSALLRSDEAAIGVNYWFADDFVIKAAYHYVDGNRFAYEPWPDGAAPATLPELEQVTQLITLGAQFSL